MRKTAIILLTALLLLISGCGGKTVSVEPTQMKVFTDSAGREVQIPENITRVAVTGQLAQIVVFSLCPDKLVSIASAWSEEAYGYVDEKYLELPVLGQIFGGSSDMNTEELAKIAPQVIIDVGEKKEGIGEELDDITQQTGIPAVHITADLFAMDEAYSMLGELLNEEAATTLGDYCNSVYQRTLTILDEVGAGNKVTALYCMGDLGTNVICSGSYHSSVIDMLTDNLAVVDNPTSKGTGNEVDMEQLYIWDPQVIFFAPNSMYSYASEDGQWQNLTAIQTGNYYEVPYGIYNWMGFPPSVQRYMGMIWMTKVLYPEYADFDLYSETQQFYELFFHCDITEEQYSQLMKNSIGKQVNAG